MKGLAAEWVENALEIHGISGDEYLVGCPWCDRPKMYVNPERLAFICFRCRQSGKIGRLIARVEGVALADAERLINPRTLVDDETLLERLRALERGESEEKAPIVQDLPPEFIPCFDGKGWRVPEYLDARGLTDAEILRHGLGYADEGRYKNRVIVPIAHGENRTFLGRLMGKPSDFRWRDRGTGNLVEPPRYLTPKSAGLSDMIYGTSWVKPGAHIIGVEGCFDAIRLIGLGFPTVAFFGKRISARQGSALRALSPASLTICFDADATSYAYLDALRMVGTVETYVAELPGGFDPDRLGWHRGAKGIRTLLDSRRPAGDTLGALAAALKNLG